ncbi:MAG: hypothetical protein Q4D79_14795 [Propionibacteriaceae bacterium]|nr:hypothetical protein [Propionibacteriaceae bacterium]
METSLWPRRLDEALIAPNATNGERLLSYGAAILGAGFAAVLAITAGLPWWTTIVLTLMGFDLFGGVVVNATPSGSRRFHSVGRPRWAELGFVAGHVHPLLLAVLTPAMPWSTAAVTYGGIVLASALIVLSGALRQASAFALAALLLAPLVSIIPTEPVVAWVAPLLVIKLLLSHLLPHAPSAKPLT